MKIKNLRKLFSPNKSLFAKVFLFFWLTLIITGMLISLILVLYSTKISISHRYEQITTIISLKDDIIERLKTDDLIGTVNLITEAPFHIQDQLRIYDNLGIELMGSYEGAGKDIFHPIDSEESPILHYKIESDLGAIICMVDCAHV